MTSVAIYARVSSARQKKDETIGSQIAALREHVARTRLELPEEWVFEDAGHSGATLVRPALERLRDLVAQAPVDVVLCHSPDRLARKFAYQALLIEEFSRAGTRVEFVNGPRGDTPEDQLMVQFQGMFAEYEKAQLAERYRRGKTYRARAGSVNVLGGAPFGYTYLRKSPDQGARYEIVAAQAALVAELFRRYADEGATLADLTRWLTSTGTLTRTGKSRWDRSVVWGMLRNPAYSGAAVFGKTKIVHEQPGLNRRARLQGRTTPRAVKAVARPREEGITIAVPAIVSIQTFERVAARLAGNARFASRNSKVASLLQGLTACAACGYGYYRGHTTTSAGNKIYYYRCLGSDDYRYEHGRVCASRPVRADYLDQVVWDHITTLLADPSLIRTEISTRLNTARTADPATRQHTHLDQALTQAGTAITRMIEAYAEHLITLDELRARIPALRTREANLRSQITALDTQIADRDAYLRLAENLEDFLTRLRHRADTSNVAERQQVLRLVVKDVLVSPDQITIRHRIPIPHSAAQPHATTDTESDTDTDCLLRRGRGDATLRRAAVGGVVNPVLQVSGLQHVTHQPQEPLIVDALAERGEHDLVVETPEIVGEVTLDEPGRPLPDVGDLPQRGMTAPSRTEPVGPIGERRFVVRLQQQQTDHLPDNLVRPGGHTQRAQLPVLLRDPRAPCWSKPVTLVAHRIDDASDLLHGHAVRGLPCGPWSHRTLIGVDAPVGQQIQLRVEHLSIQLITRQVAPAALTQDTQHRFGVLHYAYLTVLGYPVTWPPSPMRTAFPSSLAGRDSCDYYGASVTCQIRQAIPRSSLSYGAARRRRPTHLLECPRWASLRVRRLCRPTSNVDTGHSTGFRRLSGGRKLASPGDWASGNPAFAISRGSPSAPPQTPGHSRWFPGMLFSLPTSRCPVSHQTQEHPSNSSRLDRGYDRAPRGAPGAFYAYVAQGIGRAFGVGTSWVALAAYNAFQLCCYGGFAAAIAVPLFKQWFGIEVPWFVFAYAALLIIAVLGANEIKLSEKVLIVLVVTETILVVFYSIAIMLAPGFHFTAAALAPSNLWGPGAGTLVVIGMTAFAGVEQSAVYIEESKNPRRTIPKATYATILTIMAVYVFASWVQISAGGPQIIARATAEGSDLFFNQAAVLLGKATVDVGHLLLGTSLLAAMLAFHNAVARYTFALGREGVLPRVFGLVTASGAPRNASFAQTGLAFGALTLYAVAGWDPLVQLFYWAATTGGLGVLFLITVTSLAVIGYFARDAHDENLWCRLVAPLLATVILLVVSCLALANLPTLFGVEAGTGPAKVVPIAFLTIFAAGTGWGLILRRIRPGVYRGIGRGTRSVVVTA